MKGKSTIYTLLEHTTKEELSLEEVKNFLRIDHDEDDQLLMKLIKTARECAQRYLNISIVPQYYLASVYGLDKNYFDFKTGPVTCIDKILVFDFRDNERCLNDRYYNLEYMQNRVTFKAIKYWQKVEIYYKAGFEHRDDIPASIILGMLNHIASLYEGRGNNLLTPSGVLQFYNDFRQVKL